MLRLIWLALVLEMLEHCDEEESVTRTKVQRSIAPDLPTLSLAHRELRLAKGLQRILHGWIYLPQLVCRYTRAPIMA